MMKNLLFSFSAFFVLILTTSCSTTIIATSTTTTPQELQLREYSVQSVMWQQNAAEYRALCYQAFNTAKYRLDIALSNPTNEGKKLAIITDIDETVLDNSPFNAKIIELNQEYTAEEWDNWVQRKEAWAVPGATEFLNYANSKGVEIFYISNRVVGQEEATLENMKKVNFPNADLKHLIFMQESGEKEMRFNKVKETHTVLLYMGDNLSDFSNYFRTPSSHKRNEEADRLSKKFGVDFIVLPNPMYGDWESKGIYQGKHWEDNEKDKVRKKTLRAY